MKTIISDDPEALRCRTEWKRTTNRGAQLLRLFFSHSSVDVWFAPWEMSQVLPNESSYWHYSRDAKAKAMRAIHQAAHIQGILPDEEITKK